MSVSVTSKRNFPDETATSKPDKNSHAPAGIVQQQMAIAAPLALTVWALLSSGCKGLEVEEPCQFHHYYEALERALVSTTENLFKLQKLFLPTGDFLKGSKAADKVGFRICLDTDPEMNKTSIQMCWNYTWSRSFLYGLITSGNFDHGLGKLVHHIVLLDETSSYIYFLTERHTLHLRNKQEHCMVEDQAAFNDAINTLATWVSQHPPNCHV